jgi:hypothetical protein
MLIRHRVAVALLLLAPAAAMAQRGGGGGGGGGFGGGGGGRGGGGRSGGPQEPTDAQVGAVSTKDIDKLNPVTIILDKKKDLKLPDSAVKVFKAMESTLRDTNKVRYRSIDSLNKLLHARDWQNPTQDDTVRAENARHQLDAVTSEIRARYDSVQTKAFTYLTSDQQTQATAFIQKVLSDVQLAEQEAMRPTNGSGGGGGRGGSRGGTGVYGMTQQGLTAPISSNDLQKMNPVTIILSKKTELALDDTLVPKLEALNRDLVAHIVPSLKAVDSLNATSQPTLGSARPSTKNPQADSVITVIRAQFDVAQSKALALLSSSQATTAAVFIEQARANALRGSGRGP